MDDSSVWTTNTNKVSQSVIKPFKPKGRRNIRYLIVTILTATGLLLFTCSFGLEIKYGLVDNEHWNAILECSEIFSEVSDKDKLFGGRMLNCSDAAGEGKRFRRLNRDSEFAFVLIAVLIISSCGLFFPTIIKKSLRRGGYIIMLEMSFGMLGLAGLAIVLMICFSSAEFFSDMAVIVNELGRMETIFPQSIHPLRENPVCKNEICMNSRLWFLILVKCVLNGHGGIGASVELDPSVKNRWNDLNDNPLVIIREGVEYEYSYGNLQSFGFCPHQGLRNAAAAFVFIGIICFWSLACAACFLKPEVGPDDDEIIDGEGGQLFDPLESQDMSMFADMSTVKRMAPTGTSPQSSITLNPYTPIDPTSHGTHGHGHGSIEDSFVSVIAPHKKKNKKSHHSHSVSTSKRKSTVPLPTFSEAIMMDDNDSLFEDTSIIPTHHGPGKKKGKAHAKVTPGGSHRIGSADSDIFSRKKSKVATGGQRKGSADSSASAVSFTSIKRKLANNKKKNKKSLDD